MDEIASLLKSGSVRILVKPNSKKSWIVGWDDARQAFRVDIAAPAENNKANLEVIRLLSKIAGPVEIIQGLRSKLKILRLKS